MGRTGHEEGWGCSQQEVLGLVVSWLHFCSKIINKDFSAHMSFSVELKKGTVASWQGTTSSEQAEEESLGGL